MMNEVPPPCRGMTSASSRAPIWSCKMKAMSGRRVCCLWEMTAEVEFGQLCERMRPNLQRPEKKKKIQTNRSFFSKPKVWISTSGVHMGTSNFEVLIEVRTETQTEEAALGYFHTVCHQTRLDLVVLERHPSRRWLWNVISTISAYWHHPDLNLTQVPTNS